ncbi:MAG: GNAT family N-acetyltransferase [Caldilineaceae bacterium]
MHIRPAVLDDTAAISALFRKRITAWQRLLEDGRVEDVPYESLSVYERWLHGGAWMAVETGAVFLNHLLLGAGVPAVMEHGGRVVGYVEAFPNHEVEPFGAHLHVGSLVAPDAEGEDSLLDAMIQAARVRKLFKLTASTALGEEAPSALARRGGGPVFMLQRYALTARTGQGFYRAVEMAPTDAAIISSWAMPAGRDTSPRYAWETQVQRLFDTMPELAQRKAHRLRLSASGQEVIVYCRQQMFEPRTVDVSMWSPKSLQPQTMVALRDWAHREGYRTLRLMAGDADARALGPDAELDAMTVTVSALAFK